MGNTSCDLIIQHRRLIGNGLFLLLALHIKYTHLLIFLRQFLHESEALIRGAHDAIVSADPFEHRRQFLGVRTRQYISVPVCLDVPLLHSREMPVERGVIVFPVAFTERQPHTKIYYAFHTDSDTLVQDRRDVLFGVIDKRQDRGQPDDRRDAYALHLLEHFDTAPGVADVRLQYPAQIVVIGRKRHLHHALRFPVDLRQQVDVPEDEVRLGLDRESEIVFENYLQAPPRQLQLFFTMHVRIRHRARADHALLPFGLQCSRQEFRRILLDLYVFERVREMIARTPAVTVDAAVSTASVDVHSVLPAAAGQDPFGIHKMHLVGAPFTQFRCTP